MAGSKQRFNIQGHIIVAEIDVVRQMRRLSNETLRQIFLQAGEHGTATITLDEQLYTIHRQSDHTFTMSAGDQHRFTV